MKKIVFLTFALLVSLLSLSQTTIFSENCGNPASTTTCVSYTGWQNNGSLTFTASATGPDVRTTLASSGYVGASGGGNIFFVNGFANRFVQISGINTANYTNLSLSFAILKTTNASTGSELVVEVSSNGTTYTALSYSLSTGSGTSNVYTVKTPSGTIPSTSNLRIRFRYTSSTSTCQFRIDDIKLTGCLIPSAPTVSYISPACDSTTISLPSNTYLQTTSNGTSTSLSNLITSSGTYYARTVSTVSGCSSVWSSPTNVDVSVFVKPQILQDPQQIVLISLNTPVYFTAKSSHSYFWATSSDNGFTWDTLNIVTPFSTNCDSLIVNVPNESFYSLDADRFKIVSINGPCYTESNYGVLYFVTPLPVELIYFKAEQATESVKVNWTTVTETNNDKFEIQRSINIMDWETVGSVAGAGFSNKYLLYTFYDTKPINGVSYYRLKQVDFDGKYDYSDISPVMFKPKEIQPKKYYDMNGIQVNELKLNNVYIEMDGSQTRKIILIK